MSYGLLLAYLELHILPSLSMMLLQLLDVLNGGLYIAGVSMVPVSWCKMKCPKTHQEEHRKVAKVQPQFIVYSAST